MNTHNQQSGAVSLFIVIFTALLITIITISFVRIMLTDQQQATEMDLSQSAYDSAQAGVEDAKRALLDYQADCTPSTAPTCAAALARMNSSVCNTSLSAVTGGLGGQEVQVRQNTTDGADVLQQAYTCVKIALQTPDYVGTLNQDDSKLVPLVGASSFSKVKLEWFSAKDLQQGTGTAVDVPAIGPVPLLAQSEWTSTALKNRPSIMRTQLMQFKNTGFSLSDFDASVGGKSDANTLFLYPSSISPELSEQSFIANARMVPTSSPVQIHCEANLVGGGYACSATLILPEPISGTSAERTAYLRLTALYKNTHYKLTLLDSTDGVVDFDGVQPEVDSTGRANDLFRRIQSRVEIGDANFPYPEAAVDSTGNVCKKFLITDIVDGYDGYETTCDPGV